MVRKLTMFHKTKSREYSSYEGGKNERPGFLTRDESESRYLRVIDPVLNPPIVKSFAMCGPDKTA